MIIGGIEPCFLYHLSLAVVVVVNYAVLLWHEYCRDPNEFPKHHLQGAHILIRAAQLSLAAL